MKIRSFPKLFICLAFILSLAACQTKEDPEKAFIQAYQPVLNKVSLSSQERTKLIPILKNKMEVEEEYVQEVVKKMNLYQKKHNIQSGKQYTEEELKPFFIELSRQQTICNKKIARSNHQYYQFVLNVLSDQNYHSFLALEKKHEKGILIGALRYMLKDELGWKPGERKTAKLNQ